MENMLLNLKGNISIRFHIEVSLQNKNVYSLTQTLKKPEYLIRQYEVMTNRYKSKDKKNDRKLLKGRHYNMPELRLQNEMSRA